MRADAASGPAHGDAEQLSACQNCGAHLQGPYCHQCGQSGHIHRTIGHVFEEFAHGVLHVDGKLWRTLPMLAFNPGRLTREYVHGKRVRYIAPLALYLFVVLLTFVVFGFFGGGLVNMDGLDLPSARKALVEIEAQAAAERRDPAADPAALAKQTAAIGRLRAAIASAEREGRTKLPLRAVQDLAAAQDGNGVMVEINNDRLEKRIRSTIGDPDLFLYKVQQKAYKLAFLLVPLSLPFVWILFCWRDNVTLYDHTVFILYSLSFMLLLTCAAVFFNEAGVPGIAGLLITFIPPVHFYAQLKGGYSLGTVGALWRAAALTVLSILVLSLYIALLFGIGLID